MTHVMLVGNPNCGKTTLFNALTGDNQRVGNWPGVTVEKKTGVVTIADEPILLTDLPGIYSLASTEEGVSLDERIAARAVAYDDVDVIINIVDACHLERHLYLTSQLLELGKPMIVALNMSDIALQRGIRIDLQALSTKLRCKVLLVQANRKIGLEELQQAIISRPQAATSLPLPSSSQMEDALSHLKNNLIATQPPYRIAYLSHRLLEGDTLVLDEHSRLQALSGLDNLDDIEILMADARYEMVHQLVDSVQKKTSDASEHLTARIDRVVLHRFWALPIFFAMMYLMFLFAINIGGAFQDFFDISTNAIFVQGSAWLLQKMHAPDGLIAWIAMGVGKGINTTLTFIPVIASMFFFLSLLETSGYMARAGFVVDKAMRALGLPGKAFVPMIVGFGCNVPAIMAARTLDSQQDRFLTVLMSPFMSCSARLAIYAVFVAAFFPSGGQNIVFSLYLIGILMAIITGFLLRKTMLKGPLSPLILELPSYHRPSLRRLLKETSRRLRYFILRAGKMIVPVCVLLGGLNALTIEGGFSLADANSNSVLSWIGRLLTPMFSPMGLNPDNWPATVGLLSGMLAKEVVIGSLNTLYAQVGQFTQHVATDFNVMDSLYDALVSVPNNLAELGSAVLNPIAASAQTNPFSNAVYGVMYEKFDGKIGAYAYMLFILLYIPCVSTMAAIRQEASRKLMWFSILWSLLVAYSVAVIFYQLATIMRHPEQSILWVLGLSAALVLTIMGMRLSASNAGGRHVITNP